MGFTYRKSVSIGPFRVNVRPLGLNQRPQTTRVTICSRAVGPTNDQFLISRSKFNGHASVKDSTATTTLMTPVSGWVQFVKTPIMIG